MPRGIVAGKPKVIYTWPDATQSFVSDLTSEVPTTLDGLPIKWRNLRELGGYAEIIDRGKVLALVGDSGDGKTTAIETLVDYWRQQGYSGIMWGPEWTKEAYVMRAIQRAGGPTIDQLRKHNLYRSLAARGVKHNYGILLEQSEVDRAIEIARTIQAWPGTLFFIEKMGLTVDSILAYVEETLNASIASGQPIAYAVFDYAQLFDDHGATENERAKAALAKVKALTTDKQIVSVVGSQVTKAAGNLAANGNGSVQHAMQYLRSDVFNLVVTISRPIDSEGHKSPFGTWRVSKNSLGRDGEVPMALDIERMIWRDASKQSLPQPYAEKADIDLVQPF